MGADINNILPENIFQIIFERSPGSILIKADAAFFTILAVSDSYLKVTSTTREAVLGKGFFDVFPESESDLNDDRSARNVFTKVIATGEKIDVPTYKYAVYNAETGKYEPHFWSCSNIPIKGDGDVVAYILNTIADITEEVKAKEAAIESESRLRIATEATGLATWDLELATGKFFYTPRMAEIFARSPDEELTVDLIRSQIAAEDMKNIVRPSHERAVITGEHLYEVKISLPDGSIRWIKTQGAVVFDEERKPTRMLGTVLDITESKRDEIRKNDFIAMASHELKTPLTSLKAYIQLLAKKITKNDDAFINNALIKADNQINKMADLIYSFLDLSRLETGKLQLKTQHFDINQLISGTIAETSLVNPDHHIIFEPDSTITVNADMEKIGQVISNFLSNAIKYSSKDTPIIVSSQIIDNCVQVSVADQGVGIKQKDQEKLFQRFYRVDNERIKNISGFGIGLYLASEIIQRHNGTIGVESQEDKGSTFYFRLPILL